MKNIVMIDNKKSSQERECAREYRSKKGYWNMRGGIVGTLVVGVNSGRELPLPFPLTLPLHFCYNVCEK